MAMLRGNLSSRPFYNERLVTMALGFIALVAVGLTVYNVSQLKELSSQRSTLVADINRDEQAALKISNDAVALSKSVDRAALTLKAGQTREANFLITQRTFSWTVFFGLLEHTMPMDVHLTSVAPRLEKGDIIVTMRILAKRDEDVQAFVVAVGKTGAFYDVVPKEQDLGDDGLYSATIVSYYLPPAESKKVAPAPKTAGKGRP